VKSSKIRRKKKSASGERNKINEEATIFIPIASPLRKLSCGPFALS
jgi:hypothetical protein